MPRIVLSNAAHTAIRRSSVRELGVWPNDWSRRVPGTSFWEVELSLTVLGEVREFQKPHEALSDTIVRMFALYDKLRSKQCKTPKTLN